MLYDSRVAEKGRRRAVRVVRRRNIEGKEKKKKKKRLGVLNQSVSRLCMAMATLNRQLGWDSCALFDKSLTRSKEACSCTDWD